jgi:hypothetical protein
MIPFFCRLKTAVEKNLRSTPPQQNKNWIPRIALVLAVALGLLTAPPPVAGADQYWDSSTNSGLQSGNGLWSDLNLNRMHSGGVILRLAAIRYYSGRMVIPLFLRQVDYRL